jgi:hypothetical protein
VQPLLPVLAHPNANVEVLVEEDLVPSVGQPRSHSISSTGIDVRVTDEHPSHDDLSARQACPIA